MSIRGFGVWRQQVQRATHVFGVPLLLHHPAPVGDGIANRRFELASDLFETSLHLLGVTELVAAEGRWEIGDAPVSPR